MIHISNGVNVLAVVGQVEIPNPEIGRSLTSSVKVALDLRNGFVALRDKPWVENITNMRMHCNDARRNEKRAM